MADCSRTMPTAWPTPRSQNSTQKPIIEKLFRSLTEINVDGNAVRRPQAFNDLVAVTGVTADQLRAILDRLRQPSVSFITPYVPVPIDAGTTIDISHEALIRRWQRIADKETGWLQQEFRDGLIWQSLVVQSEAFAANPQNFLSEATTETRGKWLTGRSEAWAKRYGDKWAEVAELLAASRREVERQRQRDEDDRRNAEALRAEQQGRAAAEQLLKEQKLATEAVNSLVFDVAQRLRDAVGVPVATVEEILNRARSLQGQLRASGYSGPELLSGEAAAHNETSQTFLTLGDTSRALEAANKAIDGYSALLTRNPDDPATLSGLSKTFSRVGDILSAQGDLSGALKSYQKSVVIAERLAKSDPSNSEWKRDLSVALRNIGDVQVARGDLASALNSYRKNLAIAKRLATSNSDNAGWQRDLSVALGNIGDVQVAQGDLVGALASYRESLAIGERLARSDPGNAGWQRDLSVALGNIGDVQVAQGDLVDALASYRKRLAITERLARSDPSNASWQRDLSVAYGISATCRLRKAILPARWTPIARASRSASASLGPIPATRAGSATSRSATTRSAT